MMKAGDKIAIGYVQITRAVDDVARAQMFLLEHPNAKGRYKRSACMATLEKVIQVISAKYPQLQARSIDSLRERNGMTKLPDLSSKLMHVGFEFKYGFEEMLEDAIECCK
ncbi:hypothetical protein K1719_047325 [Acacia pycnantha]|nr:hypothetical protein K1719_047325 [Acacia pycnantha]